MPKELSDKMKNRGKKVAATNIERYGPDFYARIGSKGGKNSGTGGFYHKKYVEKDEDFIREAGRKGGAKSRRGPKVREEE